MLKVLTGRVLELLAIVAAVTSLSIPVRAADTVEDYIREYPNQQQTRMMNAWLQEQQAGHLLFYRAGGPDRDHRGDTAGDG